MQKINPKKIKSAPRHLLLAGLGSLVLLSVVGFTFVSLRQGSGLPETERLVLTSNSGQRTAYDLEVARTTADQEKGLGNRSELPKNRGMLFRFAFENTRCFWMKDMRFNIDIIWLNATGKVTHMEPDVTPATYPQTYCASAQNVIELNAGEAAKHGVRVGQSLRL